MPQPLERSPESIAAGYDRAMLMRTIPASGEAIPSIGLGTWQVFDVAPTDANLAPRAAVLDALLACGGTVIDSSPMYGRAEEVSGRLIARAGAGASVFIATKVWTQGRDQGIAQMRRSLRLFGTRRIDLMQIHNLLDWKTHLATLAEWRAQGLVRYVGITHYTTAAFATLADIIAAQTIDFVQLPYSIALRDAERTLLPLARERGVAVLVNRPFEAGALFRRVRGAPLPDWAAAFGATTWAAFFLKYILANPAVSCVIPASADSDHVREIVAAGEGRLPDAAELKRMAAAFDAL